MGGGKLPEGVKKDLTSTSARGATISPQHFLMRIRLLTPWRVRQRGIERGLTIPNSVGSLKIPTSLSRKGEERNDRGAPRKIKRKTEGAEKSVLITSRGDFLLKTYSSKIES